jgi:hypothetical protein
VTARRPGEVRVSSGFLVSRDHRKPHLICPSLDPPAFTGATRGGSGFVDSTVSAFACSICATDYLGSAPKPHDSQTTLCAPH